MKTTKQARDCSMASELSNRKQNPFPQTSYFHYGKVPCSSVRNDSPCDFASMQAEKEQFLSDIAIIFDDNQTNQPIKPE